MMNDVGSRSGNVSYDSSKLSDKAVEEGRFSDVRCSYESDVHFEERVKNKDFLTIEIYWRKAR
jgi:hypothetical protein